MECNEESVLFRAGMREAAAAATATAVTAAAADSNSRNKGTDMSVESRCKGTCQDNGDGRSEC